MTVPWSTESDGIVRFKQNATEYEFVGEPSLPTAEDMKHRIAEMRLEIEDAHSSTRTLLALTKLRLLELE